MQTIVQFIRHIDHIWHISQQRLRYLSTCNRKLLLKNRHVAIFVAGILGQCLVQPEVVAAPIMPILNGTVTSDLPWQSWSIYIALCLAWFGLQGALLASDKFVQWCHHLPLSMRQWQITKIIVLLGAIGPMWLPWLLGIVLQHMQHHSITWAWAVPTLMVFVCGAYFAVYRHASVLAPVIARLRHQMPLIDLQLGILYEKHAINVALRILATLSLLALFGNVIKLPEHLLNAPYFISAAFIITTLFTGGVVTLLAVAHAETAHYFAHLPFATQRQWIGDALAAMLCALVPVIVGMWLLYQTSADLQGSLVLGASALLMTGVGAHPTFTRGPNGRLIYSLLVIASLLSLTYALF